MAERSTSLPANDVFATPTSPPAPASPPIHLTQFIGRERELDCLQESLVGTRLLTLTGAGGSGKSRLAAELTSRPRTLPVDCVRWIELASLVDGAALPNFVVAALGIHDHGHHTAISLVAGALGAQPTLLVVDNCEHVVEPCARFVDALLQACPTLRILATSREPLGISGELAWLVPPLSLPSDGERDVMTAGRSEAVRLFTARARDVVPTFTVTPMNAAAVVQICRQLGGLPLAVELAAARTKVLAPEQIAARLGNIFSLLTSGTRTALPRHRTLRATMDWSYDLLNRGERLLLHRTAVFNGDFSLDAAEAVCAFASLAVDDVLDTLSALVDKSLVVVATGDSEARYRLLEPVRQYAAERLRDAGEIEPVRQRHAEYYLSFVEAAEPHIFAAGHDSEWVRRLELEEDNVRGAFDWALADLERAEIALRFAAALHWYWFAQGLFREAMQRTNQALATNANVSPRIRARALIARGQIAVWRGDSADLLPPMHEAVELLRGSDAQRDLACALAGEGTALGLTGSLSASSAAFEESIALVHALGETSVLTMFILYSRGRIAYVAGDLPLARASFEAALDSAHSSGASLVLRHVLTALGRVDLDQGWTDDAARNLKESVRLHSVARDTWGTVIGLVGLARAAASSRPKDAATLLGAAGALRDRMGVRLLQFRIVEHDKLVATLRQTLGEADFFAAREAGSQLDTDSAIALALAVPIADDTAAAPRQNTPSAPATTSDARDRPAKQDAPYDLRVLALGPLEIEFRGRPVTHDAWRSAKPRELLLHLLVHRRGRTRDEVGLAFWPDASPSEVKNNFHVTMHRLRHVLDDGDCITLDHDRYRLAPDLRIEFDAELFDHRVTESLRLLRDRAAGAGAALAAALSWYRGEFAEGERFSDWHVEPRDRLSRLFTAGLLAWADWAAGDRRFAEAADAYRRLIARDPLNEAAYRGLMVALGAQGDRAQALKLFQQLTTLLRTELDAAPSAETTRIHREIRSAANA